MRINLAWLYAITKYGYPPSFDDTMQVLEDAGRLGFKCLELEAVGSRNLDELCANKKRLSEKVDSMGLSIVNFAGIFREVFSSEKATRRRGVKLFKRTVILASELGSQTIQTDTFTPPMTFRGEVPYREAVEFGRTFSVETDASFSWDVFWRGFVSSLRELSGISEDFGLPFLIEPRVGETIGNSDAMLRALDAVDSENFGVVLDCGHLHAQKEILPLSIEKLGSKIKYVHISDNDGKENLHLAPGMGTIDWEAVFTSLKKHRFNGYLAVDVGGKQISTDLDQQVLATKSFLERACITHSLC